MEDKVYKELLSGGWSWPGSSSILRIESQDKENMVVYRNLDSGVYVLNGCFRTSTATYEEYGSDVLVAVRKGSSTSYVQVFYPNGKIECLQLSDVKAIDRTTVQLNSINGKLTAPTVTKADAGKFLRVSSTGTWAAESYEPPTEYSSIILKSSTNSSSKKFKITVDDTGALKAEEVTN